MAELITVMARLRALIDMSWNLELFTDDMASHQLRRIMIERHGEERGAVFADAIDGAVHGLLWDEGFGKALGDIEVAAHAIGEWVERWPQVRGPGKDVTRHSFVVNVMEIFEALAERRAAVSRPADSSQRGGPAARFLAGICRLLLERLPDQIWATDPKLRSELTAAASEATAGQWVEEALKYQERQRQARKTAISESFSNNR